MRYLGILLLCIKLFFLVEARNDCPKECTCTTAHFGGLVANCEQLNEHQNFSSINHLNVTNLSEDLRLTNNFFENIGLKYVQGIKICNSRLTYIDSKAFNGLEQLMYVDLSDNKLTNIHPDTFENNSNLHELSLAGNDFHFPGLNRKPNYFLKSSSLTLLDLSRCNISYINRETFSEVRNLVMLNLESNNLSKISPEFFNKLERLEEINVANNYISDVDIELFLDSQDLTKINLSKNSLTSSDNLDMEVLTDLDLSYNNFVTLDVDSVEGVPDLTTLNFSHNSIRAVDGQTFIDLLKLRYLDLSYNDIAGPFNKNIFKANAALETLFLSHNYKLTNFTGFAGSFPFLYTLDISFCGINQLDENAFDDLQNLSTLDLSGNQLTSLNPTIFSKLTRLNNLDLSENRLTSLPDELFFYNMDLRRLSIKKNKIHHISVDLLKPVIHLEKLDASNCYFAYLWTVDESVLMQKYNVLKELSYLNLEGNKLNSLHRHNFNSMANLKALDISNNPFHCNEQFVLLIQWLVEKKITPVKYIGKSSSDLASEHAEFHWGNMLNKICLDDVPIKNNQEKLDIGLNEIDVQTDSEKIESDFHTSSSKILDRNALFNFDGDTKPFLEPDMQFGEFKEQGIAEDEDCNSWLGPAFLFLYLAGFFGFLLLNVFAIFLYRSARNNKSSGYRSTFITPFVGGVKVRRGDGPFYRQLYEECSVPNSVQIKNPNDFGQPANKNIITLDGTTKGEDMV